MSDLQINLVSLISGCGTNDVFPCRQGLLADDVSAAKDSQRTQTQPSVKAKAKAQKRTKACPGQ